MKKNIYYFFLFFTAIICCVSCGVKEKQNLAAETPTVDAGAAEAPKEEAPCLILDKFNNLVGTRRCSQIEKLNIYYLSSKSRYKIESNAFQNCPNLKEIFFAYSENVGWIDDDAFQNCNSELTVYCKKGTTLQKRVQELGVKWKEYTDQMYQEKYNNKEASYFIMNEKNVLFGYGEDIIDENMYLPSETVKIHKHAFINCTNIKEITIPENVTEIGAYAFSISDLTKVHFMGNKLKKIGKGAFGGTKLKNVTIPEGVERIGRSAFLLAPIKNLKFPKSVKQIGEKAVTDFDCDPTVWVYKGSAADKYFEKEDFKIKYRD